MRRGIIYKEGLYIRGCHLKYKYAAVIDINYLLFKIREKFIN